MIFAPKAPAEETPAILESRHNAWRTLWKNDGADYPALLQSFLAGEIQGREFKRDYSTSVTQADALGRRFIFKHYYRSEARPEKYLWHCLTGTFYSRILRLTSQAIANGCQNAQDIYLVSERMEKYDAKEVWMIAEFIPGEELGQRDPQGRREQIFRTMAHIHRCGLASNDLHRTNMIVTPAGDIHLIDVSINTFLIISQIKDIMYLERRFGGAAPFREILLPTFGLRCLHSLMRARESFRLWLRRLRGTHDRDGRKIVKN